MSIEDEKDCHVRSNGQGYILTVGDLSIRISPGEARGLLTSLLHTLPEVPNGVRLAERIYHAPRVVMRRIWTQSCNVISPNSYQAYVYVDGIRVDRTNTYQTPEDAMVEASRRWGTDLEIDLVEDAPGSELFARRKAFEWLIQDYQATTGKSVAEIHRLALSGDLPESFTVIIKGSSDETIQDA